MWLKLRVQTNEAHDDESHHEGLFSHHAAVLATGCAAVVDIEKTHTGKCLVGGLEGEETVPYVKTAGKLDLSFLRRYAWGKTLENIPRLSSA